VLQRVVGERRLQPGIIGFPAANIAALADAKDRNARVRSRLGRAFDARRPHAWLAGDIQSVKAVLEKIVAVNDQLRGACVQVSADAQPGHMCRLPSISPLPQPVPHTHAAHRL